MADKQVSLTDQQQGWNRGLNLVFDKFGSAAWQRGLAKSRAQVAETMEAKIQRKASVGTPGDKETMRTIAEPFVAWLKGESLLIPPFDRALPEAEGQARIDALEIVFDAFESLRRGSDPQRNWTWNEIGDDLEKLVEFEGRDCSLDYQAAMADVVRPFYRMLKEVPQQTPPLST